MSPVFGDWEPDRRLVFADSVSLTGWNDGRSIAATGSLVHIVWEDGRDGNREVYYKRSTNAGADWGPDARLTHDPGGSMAPAVAVGTQGVHVVWYDTRDGNTEVYHKRNAPVGSAEPARDNMPPVTSTLVGATVVREMLQLGRPHELFDASGRRLGPAGESRRRSWARRSLRKQQHRAGRNASHCEGTIDALAAPLPLFFGL